MNDTIQTNHIFSLLLKVCRRFIVSSPFKMLRRIFYILIPLLCFNLSTKAYHIVGGDLTYRCLGGNTYEIIMTIYRDCGSEGAEYDDPGNIAIYNDTLFTNLVLRPLNIQEIPADIYDPCFTVPTGVCVQKGFYTATVTLPPNFDGYTVSYQRCCRNSSLRNISTPDAVGTTITTKIAGALSSGCNSSPVFKNSPPLAICLGSEFRFDHSATDPEGDSLVYKFCDPYTGGGNVIRTPGPPNSIMPIPATKPPYSAVPWSGGHSANNPFNLASPFQIDQNTGLISGTPLQLGQYLYGICVEEYRNGIKIGETRREFQVNIVICESNTEANFVAPDKCQGMELTFDNTSITSRTFNWDFDLQNPGILQSSAEIPTVVFPDTGAYTIRLIANPQYKCADTIEKTIYVYPQLKPEITGNLYACLSNPEFEFEATGTFEPYTKMDWTMMLGNGTVNDTGRFTDTITYNELGSFEVKLEMKHAICSASAKIFPEVVKNPTLKTASRNLKGCAPLLVQMENISEAASELETIWTFGRLLKSSSNSTNVKERWRLDAPGKYTISLLTYTTDKCIDTLGPVVFPIEVYESPQADFYLSDTVLSIFNPEINVFSNPRDADDCKLYLGKSNAETACSGTFSFATPGVFRVSQMVSNQRGCTDTLSKRVKVENEYAFFAPNSFTPNTDGRNETFRPVVIGSKEYVLEIFDRWGHIIFTTDDPKTGWNGMDHRTLEMAPVGVYLYKAKVLDYTDEYHFYGGEINLFR